MYIIQHGRTRKAWIDPKDIHTASDVPFVPPVYPTDESKIAREERLIAKEKMLKENELKQQHNDWNVKEEVKPLSQVETKVEPTKEISKPKKKGKGKK